MSNWWLAWMHKCLYSFLLSIYEQVEACLKHGKKRMIFLLDVMVLSVILVWQWSWFVWSLCIPLHLDFNIAPWVIQQVQRLCINIKDDVELLTHCFTHYLLLYAYLCLHSGGDSLLHKPVWHHFLKDNQYVLTPAVHQQHHLDLTIATKKHSAAGSACSFCTRWRRTSHVCQ